MKKIRKLELSDIEQIITLRIAIQKYDLRYDDDAKIILNDEELVNNTRKYLKECLNDNLFLFGFFIDDLLIANCGFYVDRHFPTYQNPSGITGYICNVYTLEEYRHKGYQRQVFDKCFAYAKELGITSFKLSSLNDIAINMYRDYGFTKSDHTYSLKVNNS